MRLEVAIHNGRGVQVPRVVLEALPRVQLVHARKLAKLMYRRCLRLRLQLSTDRDAQRCTQHTCARARGWQPCARVSPLGSERLRTPNALFALTYRQLRWNHTGTAAGRGGGRPGRPSRRCSSRGIVSRM